MSLQQLDSEPVADVQIRTEQCRETGEALGGGLPSHRAVRRHWHRRRRNCMLAAIVPLQTPTIRGNLAQTWLRKSSVPAYRTAFGLLIAAFALSACADGVPGLDFDFRNNGISSGTAQTAPRPEPDANGLISYPSYQVAVARQGDTVGRVAQRIGLSPADLAAFNARDADDVLRDGEILALPQRVGANANGDITEIASAAIDAADGPGDAVPGAATEGEPLRHTVRRGETAFSVARLYNVSVRALAEWNGLGPDLAVREGQTLIIPLAVGGGAVVASTLPDDGLPGDSAPPPPPSAADPLPEPVETADLPDAPDLSDTSEPAPTAPPIELAAESRLQRPVQGSILRGFSSANEGVDIATAEGTPVLAADDGEVAAITRDTEQIPILVVRHPGGMLTVYANIRNISVERGDRVSRGQQVAEVGPGDPPFLHFEVRQGFEAVDPQPLIE
ncbi:MAG: peptidoglycan DD-metalloendopeptidase family protein [Pseudomonadota bacterium]